MFSHYSQNKYPKKKTIITCHRNADFDAVTALIGISLFFPDAQLVFPGTQEKALQDFYEELVQPLFHSISPKDIDYENIERLVVVDTQNLERIDHLMPLLLRHGLVPNNQKNPVSNTPTNNCPTVEAAHTGTLQNTLPLIPHSQNMDAREECSLLTPSLSHIDSPHHVKTSALYPPLEILIWDHHPTGDLVPDGGKCALVGSSCTLVCEEIKDVFGKIPCEFAYLLGLGIYIDTGSFSYTSTTTRDYFAAAWLLEQGFSPDFVSPYTHRSLSKEHLALLNDLVDSAQIIDLAGIRFVITSARADEYINDFASIIPQFMEVNPCQVLFALAAMKDSIQVVARSKDEAIDVGKICSLLGGGGHAYAAAAMVKDKLLPEIISFLQTQISLLLHTDKTAKRLMTSPVLAVFEYDSIDNAEKLMSHYGLKAVPVYKANTKISAGWLEYQLAIKAISHGLGSVSVSAYMHRNFRVVTQEANLQTLMDIIVGERQRLVPVVYNTPPPVDSICTSPADAITICATDSMDDSELLSLPVLGVITRTDLIHIFLDDGKTHLPTPRQTSNRKKNVEKMLNLRTPAQCVQLLKIIGQLASECGTDTYVVGGFVRDLLMDKHGSRWPNMDIDLVVEGNGIIFAHKLADLLQGRVREHSEFLTALIIFNASILKTLEENPRANHEALTADNTDYSANPEAASNFELRIDVATARLEYYQSPAALPTVELSSIRMDLTRRDFSINAMAIHLNTQNFGELVDFFDGQNDIKQKRIRILHALSFVEDPTRALRAIRFEQRYQFKMGAHCDRLIHNSIELGLIEKLSGKRVLAELSIILQESSSLNCLLRLQEFNLLSAIHPALDLSSKEKQSFLEECHKVLDWHKLLYLDEKVDKVFFFIIATSRSVSTSDIKDLLNRLAFLPTKTKEILLVRSKLIRTVSLLDQWITGEMLLSELHNILQGLPIEALLFLLARTHSVVNEELRKKLSFYIYKSRLETIEITGNDLISLGAKKGPLIGALLREILVAKMDEKVNNFDEEMLLAKERLDFYTKEK